MKYSGWKIDFIGLGIALSLFAPALADRTKTDWRVSDEPLDDGDTAKVLWFQTKAGVNYQLEHSSDLENWTTAQSFYGLGHEISVTLFTREEVTNIDIPQAEETELPLPLVSIRMESRQDDGLGLSWISQRNGESVRWEIPGQTLSPQWHQVLHFASKQPNYHFFIMHVPETIADGESPVQPPNEPLSAEDAAVIAAFTASLPAMTQEVIDQVSSPTSVSLNRPVGQKGWYRLVADWGFSGDGDARPDWVEFEDGETDAFSGDSDGDGFSDEGDYDGDGILDHEDALISDRLVDWKAKPGVPQFILIPIESLSDDPGAPVNINNEGAVAFENEVWHFNQGQKVNPIPVPYQFRIPQPDGSYTTREYPYTGRHGIRFLTDRGKLVGTATLGQEVVSGDRPAAVIWNSRDAVPQYVGADLPLWTGGVRPLETIAGARDGYFVTRTVFGEHTPNNWGNARIVLWSDDNQGRIPVGTIDLPQGTTIGNRAVMTDGKALAMGASPPGEFSRNFCWEGANEFGGERFEWLASPSIMLIFAP